MQELIRHRDLMNLGKGAALAAVAGLVMGAAMQPDLDGDGLIAPQIELPRAGERVELTAYDPGVAAYGRNPPEYVIGTDYTRPVVMEQAVLAYDERSVEEAVDEAAYEAPVVVYEADAERREAAARTAWREEPAPEPLYPSQQGNTYYASDLPDPPSPPETSGASSPA